MNPSNPHLPPPRQNERAHSQKSHRPIVVLLSTVLLAGVLAGCSLLSANRTSSQGESTRETNTDNGTPSETRTDTEQESSSDAIPDLPSDPTMEDLRLYYEALLSQLNDTLLEERAEWFLSEYNYQQRIKELEKALEEAKEENAPTGGTSNEDTKPVVGTPQPSPDGDENPKESSDENSGNDVTDNSTGADNTPSQSPADPAADYTYTVSIAGVTIHAYIGDGGQVAIPASIEGRPVVAIADEAFKNKNVTSVAIPDTVVSIGWFAFYGCHALTQVTIPASVTAIEYAAFDGCPSLTVYCAPGSYAATYAVSFGIKHQII